eukprot:g11778.t1
MVKGVKSVRGRRQQPKAKAKAAAEPAEPRQGMLLRFDGSGYLQVLDDQAPGFAPSAGALPILAAAQQLLAKKALEEMPPDSQLIKCPPMEVISGAPWNAAEMTSQPQRKRQVAPKAPVQARPNPSPAPPEAEAPAPPDAEARAPPDAEEPAPSGATAAASSDTDPAPAAAAPAPFSTPPAAFSDTDAAPAAASDTALVKQEVKQEEQEGHYDKGDNHERDETGKESTEGGKGDHHDTEDKMDEDEKTQSPKGDQNGTENEMDEDEKTQSPKIQVEAKRDGEEAKRDGEGEEQEGEPKRKKRKRRTFV